MAWQIAFLIGGATTNSAPHADLRRLDRKIEAAGAMLAFVVPMTLVEVSGDFELQARLRALAKSADAAIERRPAGDSGRRRVPCGRWPAAERAESLDSVAFPLPGALRQWPRVAQGRTMRSRHMQTDRTAMSDKARREMLACAYGVARRGRDASPPPQSTTTDHPDRCDRRGTRPRSIVG